MICHVSCRRFVRNMKEQTGTGAAQGAMELTIPHPSTRARGGHARHERVAGEPMSNILEAWRMYRRFGRGPMRLRKRSFSTSQLRRQYVSAADEQREFCVILDFRWNDPAVEILKFHLLDRGLVCTNY